jgi:uncharacterized protein (DUF885 family)
VATAYVEAHFQQFPEDAAGAGYPGAPMDRFSDQSADALAAWEAREDAWVAELRSIDPASVNNTLADAPYWATRERLEAVIERRQYRPELWNVSIAWAWPMWLPTVLARQPVGSEEARDAALARVRDIARMLDTEVDNLRRGVASGFVATRENAAGVLAQVDELLAAAPDASPLHEPAARDGEAKFADALSALIEDTVHPAIVRYRDFLEREYLARTTTEPGLRALPCGSAAYAAAVRYHASISRSAADIQQTGLEQMERIEGEMLQIARRDFGTSDVGALLRSLREDPRYTFRSPADVLAYSRAAVERARAALPRWFGRIPRADVEVRPFPAFQKRTGGGLYSAPSADGSHPGVYEVGTHQAETLSRATAESTAFHETWPGHHLQIALAMETPGLHDVLRYLFTSGFVEGWALYSERLADEMELYSSPADRLGMLSNEAFRAARLVIDPGLHVMGWSREQAIRYMLQHTAESEAAATYEVDRYISGPGQAVSYLLGAIEIQRLRRAMEHQLGSEFQVRIFHDRVLEDGNVTLPMLTRKLSGW